MSMTKQEIIKKVTDAIDDMATKVEFRNSRNQHLYVNVETGEWLQGVSTVSSIVPKDWLAAWGAKEAVRALGYSDYSGDTALAEEMLLKIKNCESVEQYLAILKEAKGGASRKSKKALVDGKAGHAWLEDYVKAKIENTSLPELPKTESLLERPIHQFLKWAHDNVEYWIASEAKICHPGKSYAGTLDAIAMLKGNRLSLVDFKFASHIGEDYYLQTAGYAAAFEPYGILFDSRMILRLPKTLEQDEWNPKTFSYNKVPNNLQAHEVPTAYEVDRDVFFACLPVKRWINYVEKMNK